MDKGAKIFVAGHRGLVGSAILRNLLGRGYSNIVVRDHAQLDLRSQADTAEFFRSERPEYVFLAAAKVGGIMANSLYRADFSYDNLMIEANVIHHAWETGVRKLLFLGSTCIYPRDVPQPMAEEALLTAPLEYTNEPYAIAKIAGIKMAESYNIQYGTDFISVMPTNLYGPNDNFDLGNSHVMPAMLRKMYLGRLLETGDMARLAADFARRPSGAVDGTDMAAVMELLSRHGITRGADGRVKVTIWGTGQPLREFMWSEDMADACVFVMENVGWRELSGDKEQKRNCHINIGTGVEVSIGELARIAARTVGFGGDICFDTSKPDGTMRKLTDVSRLHGLGWHHTVELEDGVRRLFDWYRSE